VNWNDGVDWKRVLGDHIANPSLADPGNTRPETFTATMVFLDSAFELGCEQQVGQGVISRNGLSWATLTRNMIIKRAARRKQRLPAGERDLVRVGEGAFKYRWPEMVDFFICLVKYGLYAPRCTAALDLAARKLYKSLPKVVAGEVSRMQLVDTAASIDMRLRIRRAMYHIFQLSLVMECAARGDVLKAHEEFLREDAERWIPVYDEVIRVLGLTLRAGVTTRDIHTIISGQAENIALRVVRTGNDAHLYSSGGVAVLTQVILIVLAGCFDHGDGLSLEQAAERSAGDDPEIVGPPR